jgi:hypothetical protein
VTLSPCATRSKRSSSTVAPRPLSTSSCRWVRSNVKLRQHARQRRPGAPHLRHNEGPSLADAGRIRGRCKGLDGGQRVQSDWSAPGAVTRGQGAVRLTTWGLREDLARRSRNDTQSARLTASAALGELRPGTWSVHPTSSNGSSDRSAHSFRSWAGFRAGFRRWSILSLSVRCAAR